MMGEVNYELDLIVKLKAPTNYPHIRPSNVSHNETLQERFSRSSGTIVRRKKGKTKYAGNMKMRNDVLTLQS